jgi:hypothetical protein
VHHAGVTKTPSALGFPAILTIADVGRSGVFRIRILKRRVAFANHMAHLRGFLRQHFLKRDAVFLSALVYSGCSAFDSRVHAAIKWPHRRVGDLTNSGGQHGQESEEGEEGEERSEEDCEEDPQGREEEVSSP